jgi:hypothetical protein
VDLSAFHGTQGRRIVTLKYTIGMAPVFPILTKILTVGRRTHPWAGKMGKPISLNGFRTSSLGRTPAIYN